MSTATCTEITGIAKSPRKLPLDAIDVATCLWAPFATFAVLCAAHLKKEGAYARQLSHFFIMQMLGGKVTNYSKGALKYISKRRELRPA
jgi:hypothetical protein